MLLAAFLPFGQKALVRNAPALRIIAAAFAKASALSQNTALGTVDCTSLQGSIPFQIRLSFVKFLDVGASGLH